MSLHLCACRCKPSHHFLPAPEAELVQDGPHVRTWGLREPKGYLRESLVMGPHKGAGACQQVNFSQFRLSGLQALRSTLHNGL